MLICDRCERRSNVLRSYIQTKVACHANQAIDSMDMDLCEFCREAHQALMEGFIRQAISSPETASIHRSKA